MEDPHRGQCPHRGVAGSVEEEGELTNVLTGAPLLHSAAFLDDFDLTGAQRVEGGPKVALLHECRTRSEVDPLPLKGQASRVVGPEVGKGRQRGEFVEVAQSRGGGHALIRSRFSVLRGAEVDAWFSAVTKTSRVPPLRPATTASVCSSARSSLDGQARRAASACSARP